MAYLETHLKYGVDAKKSRLQGALYFIEDNLTASDPIPESKANINPCLKKRHAICTPHKTFDMNGLLHVDVFNQSKYLLNGIS